MSLYNTQNMVVEKNVLGLLLVVSIFSPDSLGNVINVNHVAIVPRPVFRDIGSTMSSVFFSSCFVFLAYVIVKQTPVHVFHTTQKAS